MFPTIRHPVTRSRAFPRLAAFVLVSLLAGLYSAACSDATAPALDPGVGEPRFESVPGSETEQVVGPFVLPGSGYTQTSMSLPSFPHPTMLEVTISGFVTAFGTSQTVAIGPHGWYSPNGVSNCWKYSGVMYTTGRISSTCNGPVTAEALTGIATMQGTGTAYVGTGNSTNCSAGECYWTYSGDRTFLLRIPRPQLKMVTRDTAVRRALEPDTVRFTAGWSPTHFRSQVIPASILGWRWKADGDSAALPAVCVSPFVYKTCKQKIARSGTVYVDARVNGRDTTDTLRVFIYTKFEIRADKQEARLGDSVTFTAFVDDSVARIPRWRWSSDSADATCAGRSTCARVMSEVGTRSMVGYLSAGDSASAPVAVPVPKATLHASQASVLADDIVAFSLWLDGVRRPAHTWTFIADDTGSVHVAACTSGTAVCEKVMRVSGTMIAITTIFGADYSDSASVVVTGECLGPLVSVAPGVSLDVAGQPCNTDRDPAAPGTPGHTDPAGDSSSVDASIPPNCIEWFASDVINEGERAFIRRDGPWKWCQRIFKLRAAMQYGYDTSMVIAEVDERTDGTWQNALQHTIWSARMRFYFGYDDARGWTDAHENVPITTEPQECYDVKKAMDLQNNGVGLGYTGIRVQSDTSATGQVTTTGVSESIRDYVIRNQGRLFWIFGGGRIEGFEHCVPD